MRSKHNFGTLVGEIFDGRNSLTNASVICDVLSILVKEGDIEINAYKDFGVVKNL